MSERPHPSKIFVEGTSSLLSQDVALDIALTHCLEQWVSNIQIYRIPDSGHWIQQEKPTAVNTIILEFLKQS